MIGMGLALRRHVRLTDSELRPLSQRAWPFRWGSRSGSENRSSREQVDHQSVLKITQAVSHEPRVGDIIFYSS